MFSVQFDAATGIVRTMVKGFWEPATVDAYVQESKHVLRTARMETGRVLVLCDTREFAVQSESVLIAFDRAEAELGPQRDRMAMVSNSMLAKMQGRRTLAGSAMQYFTDPAEAERWLLHP